MTQEAIVIRTLPDSRAEVLVKRQTACGNNCGSCESCIYQSELMAVARNQIGAKPGQKVTIATANSKVFSAGDMHRGQSLVVWAICEGRECAKEIDEYLMGYTNL